jgi:hypothetical protein
MLNAATAAAKMNVLNTGLSSSICAFDARVGCATEAKVHDRSTLRSPIRRICDDHHEAIGFAIKYADDKSADA